MNIFNLARVRGKGAPVLASDCPAIRQDIILAGEIRRACVRKLRQDYGAYWFDALQGETGGVKA